MFRVLQIDGGGIKGVIPAKILSHIEKVTGQRICEMFDLITGTSTGAVIGGVLASGQISAVEIYNLYKKDVVKLFSSRPKIFPVNWFKPKYDRAGFVKILQDKIGEMLISQCRCDLMVTGYGLAAGRTHFVKSWENKDGRIKLVDAITWSALSAAYYFGAVDVPNYRWSHKSPEGDSKAFLGESFGDGGQGINNCTIAFALVEIMARAADVEGVEILSLGCGDFDDVSNYSKSKKIGYWGEVLDFPLQARSESAMQQVMAAEYVASRRPNFLFHRINCSLPKKVDKLDAVDHITELEERADWMIGQRYRDVLERFVERCKPVRELV